MNEKNENTLKKAKLILDYYFEETTNVAMDEKIQHWLVDDQNRQEKDDALKQIWDNRIEFADNPDRYAYASLKKIHKQLGFRKRPARKISSFYWKAPLAVAAVILLGCIFSVFFTKWDTTRYDEIYADAPAPVKTIIHSVENTGWQHIVLPDNSEVWVRRDGVISFPDNFSTGRMVNLLEGEAYFSVTKQDGNPFTVVSENITVGVLGTEFYVKTVKNVFSEVTLTEGLIEITTPEGKLEMKPGDDLIYDNNTGDMTLSRVELTEIVSWKGIDLVFANTPLKDVFQRISTYFNIAFAIDNNLLLDKTLTAAIDQNESLEEVMFIVQNTIRDFDYNIYKDSIVNIARYR
jgi:ferric-dicitrate binding protein FerR (iron transport regulator)